MRADLLSATYMEAAPHPSQSSAPRGIRKQTAVVLAGVAAMVLLAIVIWVRGKPVVPSADDTPVVQRPNAVHPRPAATRPAATTRPTHAASAHAKHTSGSDEGEEKSPAQPGEAQILVATGYRRMQQHDFEAAREAFEEALSIDPRNSAAKQGLRAAKSAETVEGVAGVLGR